MTKVCNADQDPIGFDARGKDDRAGIHTFMSMLDNVGARLIHGQLEIEHRFIGHLMPVAAIRNKLAKHGEGLQFGGAGDLVTWRHRQFLILPTGKGIRTGMATNLLDHFQVIPLFVDHLQYAIVNGPGTAANGLPLVRLAKRSAAMERFV